MVKNDTSKDTSEPLLREELSAAERIILGQLTQQPGFNIIVRMHEAACARANNDAIKLDPEEDGYERKLSVRTQRTRNFNECVNLVRKSINWHVEAVVVEAQQDDQQVVDAVAKTFGIHKVTKKKVETPAV
jgi:hypothetical protein